VDNSLKAVDNSTKIASNLKKSDKMKFGIRKILPNSCECPYCHWVQGFYKWSGSTKKYQCRWCRKFFKLPLKKENNV